MKENATPHCDHCGKDCLTEYPLEDKVFCCEGCKSVYQILTANGLEGYYAQAERPGVRKVGKRAFNFLDNLEIQEKLLDFNDGGVSVVRLFLPAIHCSACLWLLENLHQVNDGIIQVRVNFPKRTAQISFHHDVLNLRQLAELLDSIGYPPQISLADEEKKSGDKDRSLIYKFGVAGFAFGNIMLMAIPEYLHPDDPSLASFQPFFRLLSAILALPVLFYSASDYFISSWKALRQGMTNIDQPIAIGVIALVLRSFYEIISQTGPGYFDSLAGLIFFLLMGRMFQRKTYESLSFDRDFRAYFPLAITVINNHQEEILPVRDVKVGDRILVRNEELIPVDAKLLKGDGYIDHAFVTGESTPVKKHVGEFIYAGGVQRSGAIELEVMQTVDQSYLTQLWSNHKHTDISMRQSLIDRFSKYFTIAILLISTMGGAYWTLHTGLSSGVLIFTAVLIVACPCALALAAPFANGHAMRVLGRYGIYLKDSEVVERLADIEHIVWDKTGTLTQADAVNSNYVGTPLSKEDKNEISSIVRQSKHPLSVLLYRFLAGEVLPIESYEEIPGKGMYARVNGHDWRIGSVAFAGAPEKVGTSAVYITKDNTYLGAFTTEQVYRNGVEPMLKVLNRTYGQTVLSGDYNTEEARLDRFFEGKAEMKFQCSPSDKLQYVEDLMNAGKHVLMVGDGLNDAGALRSSYVGISMADDVNNFTPASDAIFAADQIEKFPRVLEFAQSVRRVVWWSIAISLLYNLVGLTFALMGLLAPWVCAVLMPISSISVVVFVSLTTEAIGRKNFL